MLVLWMFVYLTHTVEETKENGWKEFALKIKYEAKTQCEEMVLLWEPVISQNRSRI